MSILVNSLLTIAGLYMVSSLIGTMLKSHLDKHYPSADRELEAFLADGLELALAKDAA